MIVQANALRLPLADESVHCIVLIDVGYQEMQRERLGLFSGAAAAIFGGTT